MVAQQTTAPPYIKADRSIIESQFGIDATEFIFSDDLTKERHDFVVRSLQRIPAQGCPDDPSFTMIQVAPLQKNTAGFAWMERFDVDCHPKVRRTWIVVAQSDSTIKTQEILPGDTIADIKLQADVARGVTATASGR